MHNQNSNSNRVFPQKRRSTRRPVLNPIFAGVLITLSIPFFVSIAIYGYKRKPPHIPFPEVSLYDAAFSAAGDYLLAGGNQSQAWVLDITKGKIAARIFERETSGLKGVASVALSPVGDKALIGDMEGNVSLWNVANCEKQTLKTSRPKDGHICHPERISRCQVALSPDAAKAAIKQSHGEAIFWDVSTGNKLDEFDSEAVRDEIRCMAFTPDGSRIAVGRRTGGEIRVFDVETKTRVGAVEHPPRCTEIAFSPDGSKMITGGGDDCLALVWDAKTFESIRSFRHPARITSLAVSPDGAFLAVGGFDGSIRVWNLQSGQFVNQFQGPKQSVLALVFTPAISNLRSVDGLGNLCEWDVVTGRCKWVSAGYVKDKDGRVEPEAFKKPEENIELDDSELADNLSRKIGKPFAVKNQRIDDVLNVLQYEHRIPIAYDPFVKVDWTITDSVPLAILIGITLERYMFDFVIQDDGTLRIGTPDAIAKIAKSSDERDLERVPFFMRNTIQRKTIRYMYIADLIEQFQKEFSFPCIVEDDRFQLCTFELDDPTPQDILNAVLLPNGLDSVVHEGKVCVSKKRDADWKKEKAKLAKEWIDDAPPEAVAKKIPGTYSVSGVSLSNMLDDLQKRTGVKFILNATPALKVKCRLNNPTVDAVLETVLPPHGLNYLMRQDGAVVVDEFDALLKKTDVLLTPSKLTSLLLRAHERFTTTQLTYSGQETHSGLVGTTGEKDFKRRLDEAIQALENRKAGTVTPEERNRWGRSTDEDIADLIKNTSRALYGAVREATYVFSVSGKRRRLDVYRPRETGTPFHYYLYTGSNRYIVIPPPCRTPVRSMSSGPCRAWDVYRFGADLDWFLKQGSYVLDVDNKTRTFRLTSADDLASDTYYKYVFLDGRNDYWKTCMCYNQGVESIRIDCMDFREIDGMLVPARIINNKRMLKYDMHLVEARINPTDVPETYFELPTGPGMTPLSMGR